MTEIFDASKVIFRIDNNFGKRCLLAEYEMKASIAIEVAEEETIDSFKDNFAELIEEAKEEYERYLKRKEECARSLASRKQY